MERLTKGKIIEIHVHDEYYVYAQVLQKGNIAYFDSKCANPIQDISRIDITKVLFILGSSVTDAIRTGRWKIRGKLPIPSSLETLPMQFIQDVFNPNKFQQYNCETGDVIPSTRAECEGLERCAVWYDNHIEDRIEAYYSNTKCIWLTSIDEWIEMNQKK